ncbi:MAG: hypothetical protein M3512_06720 [Bacteroidota bacterium]|nr:hypothetical protein [Bacteroidota bacterium]
MDIEEMKKYWDEEDAKLKYKLKLKEDMLMKMKLDKVVGELDKMINVSVLGRNLAFVYFLISLWYSSANFNDFEYSIPGIVGGLLMLWSFVHHLKIKKPQYFQMSLIELQKTIRNFREHTAASSKYDIGIVFIWYITLIPVILKSIFGLSIWKEPLFFAYIFWVFLIVAVLLVFSIWIYKKYDEKLKESENYLDEILEFENQ